MKEVIFSKKTNFFINKKNKRKNYIVWVEGYNGVRCLNLENNLKVNANNFKIKFFELSNYFNLLKNSVKMPHKKIKFVTKKKLNLIITKLKTLILGNSLDFSIKLAARDRKSEWFVINNVLCVRLVDLKNVVKYKTFCDFKHKIYKQTVKDKKKSLEQSRIKIKSSSLMDLLTFTSLFRKLQKPNHYTGKGIRYLKDIVQNRISEKSRVLARKKKK